MSPDPRGSCVLLQTARVVWRRGGIQLLSLVTLFFAPPVARIELDLPGRMTLNAG